MHVPFYCVENPTCDTIDLFFTLRLLQMCQIYVGDEIRISDVMTHLSISRSTAHRLLNELVENGSLQRIGEGAAARYRKG